MKHGQVGLQIALNYHTKATANKGDMKREDMIKHLPALEPDLLRPLDAGLVIAANDNIVKGPKDVFKRIGIVTPTPDDATRI